MKKALLALLLGVLIAGSVQGQMSSWSHVVQSSEYSPAKTQEGKEYLVYTCKDARFNTTDWFDTWIEDWAEKSGAWSDFAPVMDGNLKLFLYDVMYNNGFVTWKTYTADLDLIVGKKLKFFQLKAR
jgi:hypothetical protein